MPLTFALGQLPSGARCVRVECHGDVTKEDAEAIVREITPGGALHGIPILGLTQGLRSVSSEARQMLGKRDLSASESWTAAVVTNPIARVTANFLMRVNKMKKERLFATEAEAVQWLEERLEEERARPKAG